jgi:hypothetical protein
MLAWAHYEFADQDDDGELDVFVANALMLQLLPNVSAS